MRDGEQYFTWGPDSKWLLNLDLPTIVNSEVVLLDATGKTPMRNLTKSGYSDENPMWVNEGKQILWFSNRDGLRSYATSGQNQNDVYTLFFNQEDWDKFRLSKEDFDLMKEIEKSKKKETDSDKDKEKDKKEEVKAVKPLTFEFEGIDERKARLSIHSSDLGDAVLSKDGETLFYLTSF